MWFKNLRLYRFTKQIDLAPATLETQLARFSFKPCGNMDFSRYGWAPPLGRAGEMLTHTCNGCTMLVARKQEKILPPAAVNEMAAEQIAELETAEGRPAYRREKQAIKEEIIHTLLPRALTRSSLIYAYLDPKQGRLLIDTASAGGAEEFMQHLRASLGSLPVAPLDCPGDPANSMTRWLKDGPPAPLQLDNECELQNPREAKNIVRCRNQELESTEIQGHLEAGKRAVRLALNWRESIRFVLAEDCSLKRLRFEQIAEAKAGPDPADKAAQFDQDFALMSAQLNRLIEELLGALGGIEQPDP